MRLLALLLFLCGPALAQNQVLELDGKGAYVQLPPRIFDTLTAATVEAWGRWDEWGAFSQWFAFGTDDQWRSMGMNHQLNSPLLQFFSYSGPLGGQSQLYLVPAGTDLPLGQWCHMAAVSGPEGMRFYLNGVLVGQHGYEGSFAAIAPTENNYLGRSSWKENAFFHGALDEVRVEVVDTTPPVVALNGDANVTIECHTNFTDPGATAADIVDGPVAALVSGSPDLNTPGTYTLTYTATDHAGNSASVSHTVEVVDTTPPTIALNGPSELTLECHRDTYTETATVSDECDPHPGLTIAGSVDTNVEGTYTLTYTATDQAGNSATATFMVHVSDTRGPSIALLGDPEVTVECHLGAYTEAGAIASDDCDGDLSARVVVTGALDLDAVGDYVLTYTVSDRAHNSAALTRTVHVVDTVKPVVTLNGPAAVNAECHVGYTDAGAIASDGCDPHPALSVTSTVDTDQLGVYLVTYVATDASGNVSDPVVHTVHVVDTTPPVVTLNGGATLTLECPAPYAEAGVQIREACDPNPVLIVTGTVDSHTPGTYTLTYTATDASGNVSLSVTRTVITRDTTPPTIALNGEASLRVVYQSAYAEAGATLTDACDLHPVLTITGAVNTSAVGVYTLTYQGRDASGNASAALTRTVEVYKTPTQRLGDLIAQINSLVASGAIPSGNGNAFIASLRAATSSLNTGSTADALSELNAFINKVKAQSGKKVSAAVADQLIGAAQQLIAQLGGSAKLAGRRPPVSPSTPTTPTPSTPRPPSATT